MGPEHNVGKLLIGLGAVLIVVGLIVVGLSRFVKLGHLPGDFSFQRGRTSVYFPLASSIVISLILTLLLNLLLRWRGPR